MKKDNSYYLIIICFIFCTNVFAQIPAAPFNKTWKKVDILSDEFVGNTLDETKWDDYHPHWSGRPPSEFKKGSAYVEGGYLKLKSTLKKDPSTVNNPLEDIWVNSAACVSKGWDAKPGYYYEARFKASSLSMTSSFWFRVGSFSEIDVIEHIGNPSVERRQNDLPFEYAANTHYYGKHAGLKNKKATWKMPERGRDDFHTYGFWWKSANELLFYYDGKEVMKIVPRVPLDENLKMIFDTEVFPFAQAGVPNIGLPKVENLNDNSKNTMLVDWVRVYELTDKAKLEDTVSFKDAPTIINQSNEYSFNVEYVASEDREIVVGFYKNGKWVASKKEKVNEGIGIEKITVNLPDLPEIGKGYSYKLHIRPLNSTWREAIDTEDIENVEVVKQFITDGTYFINSVQNEQRLLARALESHSARMHGVARFDDQKWIFKRIEKNVYTIKNKGTKRYLEVPNRKCVNGANVATWTSANENHQKWIVVENGNGVYGLKPLHCENLGLDVSAGAIDANVQIWSYDVNNRNQKWRIVEVESVANRNIINSDFETLVNDKKQIVFYPNPSKEKIVVSGLEKGDDISIYDLQGKKVKTLKSNREKEEITISDLSQGIYLIKINNKAPFKLIKN